MQAAQPQPEGEPEPGPDPGPDPGPRPMAGFTVLLTASRRVPEWTATLTRQGAEVISAPVLRMEPCPAPGATLAATRAVIDEPPDDMIITTSIGLRSWIEVAEADGLGADLLAALRRMRLWPRGAKVVGAAHTLGLGDRLAGPGVDTTAELVAGMIAAGVAGRSVGMQLHGETDARLLGLLADACARVVTVPVYGWAPAADAAAVQRGVLAAAAGGLDAVVFASLPGAQAFLDVAGELGRREELVAAFRGAVLPAAIGPVTATPLRASGLDPLIPDRFRLGSMVRTLARHLHECAVLTVRLDGGLLQLRGRVATLDGEPVPLGPAGLAVLRRLAVAPGEVVSREALLAVLSGGDDAHAVEVAVSRVRRALSRPGVVQTVVKRGYRLAVRT